MEVSSDGVAPPDLVGDLKERSMAPRLSKVERRLSGLIRRVFSLGLGGVIAGALVGGLGGRIVMRISAMAAGDAVQGVATDAGNRVGNITVGGMIGLILFGGVLSGAAGGIIIVASERWLPMVRATRGLSVGVFILAAAGYNVIESGNRDFRILDPPMLNVTMFAGIFILFGMAAIGISDRVERRLNAASVESTSYGLLLPIALAAVLIIPIAGSFFSEEFCDCNDPPVIAGGFVLVAVLATLLSWIDEIRNGAGSRLWISIVGWIGVGGAALTGALRLADEVRIIV